MKKDKPPITIVLTPEQQEQIRQVLGKTAPQALGLTPETLDLAAEVLEERVAPDTTPAPICYCGTG
jgi:hypothetical protein